MVEPAHINADYPESYQETDGSSHRSSDHDPLLIGFSPAAAVTFLPLVIQ
jgi:predicted extracellular nuclease